jgi:signal transduction histidine kinase/CheY-like chemotaxis protein
MIDRPKILIIDDDPGIQMALKELFADHGYKIVTSINDKDAVEKLITDGMDLILLDIVNPGMDRSPGMDQFQRRWPDTPIIIMAEQDSMESALEALRKGAYDYLRKPLSNEKLLRAIKNALDHKKSVTVRKQAEDELRRNYDTQAAMNSLLRYSLEDMSLDELLKLALDLILSIPWLAFKKQGSIFLVEDDPHTLVMKAHDGLAQPIMESCARLPFGKCHCGRAAQSQEIQFSQCLDERHEIRYDGITPHGHFCVPICFGGETLGVINMYIREDHRWVQREEDFLKAVANTLAGIIMRKRLEEGLVKSERLAAIGQTVAGLAHCIKNILFHLEGGVYIVDKGLRKDDIQKLNTGWNMVRKNIDKVSDLVMDLLNYSKERKPKFEFCSPNTIAEEVCELMEPKAEDAVNEGIKVVRDFDPNIGYVQLDPKGIHRCLLNLVSNGIDACLADESEDKEYKVTVTTLRQEDKTIAFEVLDNGCGMDEDIKQQLFASFFSTKGSKGTGLGLLVTQKIVQEHGGVLSVNSEPGKGSTFTMVLPQRHEDS